MGIAPYLFARLLACDSQKEPQITLRLLPLVYLLLTKFFHEPHHDRRTFGSGCIAQRI